MSAAPHSATPDPFGEALHFLRMSGVFYCRSELTRPWGLALPELPDCLWFHVVTSGECHLDNGEPEPVVLRPGEFALVPHGKGHYLRSDPGVPTPDVRQLPHDFESDIYAVLRHGADGSGEAAGASTTLMCGAVRFDHPAARRLVSSLPSRLHLTSIEAPQAEWMHSTLRLMAEEAGRLLPGGETVLTRLCDVLVIQAIRAWLDENPAARAGWLAGLRDPQIGRALALMHQDPARPWTVESLARELAMSRSAFAARFTEVVGEPAMRYLTRWRMQVAVDWLRTERVTVAELATRFGYRSEAAFSRAFTRTIGVAPGTARRGADRNRPEGMSST